MTATELADWYVEKYGHADAKPALLEYCDVDYPLASFLTLANYIDHYSGAPHCWEYFSDAYKGVFDSDITFAKALVHDGLWHCNEIAEAIRRCSFERYINYALIAQDALAGAYWHDENGHYFREEV